MNQDFGLVKRMVEAIDVDSNTKANANDVKTMGFEDMKKNSKKMVSSESCLPKQKN